MVVRDLLCLELMRVTDARSQEGLYFSQQVEL